MAPPPQKTDDPSADDPGAARMEALKKALERSALRPNRLRMERRGGAPFEQRRLDEQDLIDEITSAARAVAAARGDDGVPVYRTDRVFRVLATVARSHYCLAIADLARALGVRKQTAHALAHAAVRARVIELVPNPQDKRILQALLTPAGRAELAAARSAEQRWLETLLNGLDDYELKATLHVVRVIRQRLERAARELDRQRAERKRRKANPFL